MKKYVYYNLITEEKSLSYYDYRNAVSEYSKAESATLYGITFEGEQVVIYAK